MTRDEWTRVEPLAMQALALPEPARQALFASVTLRESSRRELLTALRSIEQFSVVQSGVATSGLLPAIAACNPSDAQPPVLASGTRLDDERYVVVRQLGHHRASTYLAKDGDAAALVILKVTTADDRQIAETERAVRVLRHPNIATIHRAFRARFNDSDIGVLVREYVDGTPATRALAEREVHVSQALRWTRQVADAIAHAHDHHLLHGRLHSGNVIITPQDDAKVVDLGIGVAALDGLADATPYTPPEQFTARNDSEQGDIYALGVLLIELLTRRLPFAGDGGVLWLRAMVEPAPLLRRFNSEVPPALQDVIDCALDKNPLRRFPSARAFKAPLDVVAEQSVTRLLEAWSAGREEALEQLLPVVYNELRRIARVQLARDRRGHTLQATDLVHEAFVRLVDQRASWRNRVHFFAIAATCMRRVLVDRARRRGAQKRPQIDPSVEIQGLERGGDTGIDWIIAVDETLHEIEKTDARQARVAELKVFTDLENEEIADVLGVSVATVKRDWAEARSILRRNLGKVPR